MIMIIKIVAVTKCKTNLEAKEIYSYKMHGYKKFIITKVLTQSEKQKCVITKCMTTKAQTTLETKE